MFQVVTPILPTPEAMVHHLRAHAPRFPSTLLARLAPGPTPDFPVELVGVGEVHAAFLNESRTRCGRLVPRTGNPGLGRSVTTLLLESCLKTGAMAFNQ